MSPTGFEEESDKDISINAKQKVAIKLSLEPMKKPSPLALALKNLGVLPENSAYSQQDSLIETLKPEFQDAPVLLDLMQLKIQNSDLS